MPETYSDTEQDRKNAHHSAAEMRPNSVACSSNSPR